MFGLYRQLGMRRKRTAKVSMIAKQYSLPKGIHFFQVGGPILYNVVKDGAYQAVVLHAAIKGVYQKLYVFNSGYITFHGRGALLLAKLFNGELKIVGLLPF